MLCILAFPSVRQDFVPVGQEAEHVKCTLFPDATHKPRQVQGLPWHWQAQVAPRVPWVSQGYSLPAANGLCPTEQETLEKLTVALGL